DPAHALRNTIPLRPQPLQLQPCAPLHRKTAPIPLRRRQNGNAKRACFAVSSPEEAIPEEAMADKQLHTAPIFPGAGLLFVKTTGSVPPQLGIRNPWTSTEVSLQHHRLIAEVPNR